MATKAKKRKGRANSDAITKEQWKQWYRTTLAARRLPESRAETARPFDAAGTIALVALLVSLVVGLSGLDASGLSASVARPSRSRRRRTTTERSRS